MKDKTTAIILSVLTGGLGIDRFYLGYTGMGILKLLTAGCFGILWIIDIVNICNGNLKPADGSDWADNSNSAQGSTNVSKTIATANSAADELKKYKELLDQGVITEDEFKVKKEQILKLM